MNVAITSVVISKSVHLKTHVLAAQTQTLAPDVQLTLTAVRVVVLRGIAEWMPLVPMDASTQTKT